MHLRAWGIALGVLLAVGLFAACGSDDVEPAVVGDAGQDGARVDGASVDAARVDGSRGPDDAAGGGDADAGTPDDDASTTDAAKPDAEASAPPQPGELDRTFGDGGVVTIDYGAALGGVNALLLQPDGKVVLGGTSNNADDFVLVRLNADGSFDSTFGTGGRVVTDLGGSQEVVNALALQTNGALVAAGRTGSNFGLARYQANGTVDSSFMDGGTSTFSEKPASNVLTSAVVLANDNIVVAGYTGQAPLRDSYFAAFKPNGTPDTNFGAAGKVVLDTTTLLAADAVTALEVLPSGQLLFSGTNGNQWMAGRLDATNGAPDTTFGGAGSKGWLVTSTTTSSESARNVATLLDGRIVLVGDGRSRTLDTAMIQLTAGGVLDTTFADAGKLTTFLPNATSSFASGLATTADGKRVLGGWIVDNGALRGVVFRQLPNGDLDPTFGTGGLTETTFEGSWTTAALQPDGRILVAGAYKITPSSYGMAVARYVP